MAYFNEENAVEQMLINAAAQRGWILSLCLVFLMRYW